MSFKPLSRDSDNNILLPIKSKRSQSALEYMMTYGWAILIIVIVAVILYSMGIFNPSSSITFTSSGFSPFTVSSSLCNNLGYKIAVLAGPIPNNANSLQIDKVYLTSATGANATTASYTLTNPVTLKSGQSATILIPNVACNAANVHYSISANIQYSYTASTLGLQTVNTTGTVAGTSISGKPSVLTSYEPVTITNSQSSATPNPFQQMVVFNSTDPGFSSIATGNFGQNVEFFYYNGTVVPSWLENYTSDNATWWLKIAAIPAGSSETVYVGFAPTSTNLFNGLNIGEASQLTGEGDKNISAEYQQAMSIKIWFYYAFNTSDHYVYTFNWTFNPQTFGDEFGLPSIYVPYMAFYYPNGTMVNARLLSYSPTSAEISIELGPNYQNQYLTGGGIPIIFAYQPGKNLSGLYSQVYYTPTGTTTYTFSLFVKSNGNYGEYDNGKYVFDNYTNFEGDKALFGDTSCADDFYITGFGFLGESICGYPVLSGYYFPLNKNQEILTYSYINKSEGSNIDPVYIYQSSSIFDVNMVSGNNLANYDNATGIAYTGNGDISVWYDYKNTTRSLESSYVPIVSSTWNLYGVGVTSSHIYYYFNQKEIGQAYNNYSGNLYGTEGLTYGNQIFTKYAMVVALPPNGIMPSILFGSLA